MDIRPFTGGSFGENVYLVVCETTGVAVVVDPGAAADAVARQIVAEGLHVDAILLTHAHVDHIEGVAEIRAVAPEAPIWLHPADYGMYQALPQQAALFGLRVDAQPTPTHELAAGQRIEFGSCAFDVRFTPGHAPGHVAFVTPEQDVAISGDVVFLGSIGRTDLPGGDFYTLMKSIREEILTLPDSCVLHVGHGPPTTVGAERVGNPFLVPHYRGEMA